MLEAYGFQPTLPVRGVTAPNVDTGRASLISTHTPRAGSDIQFLEADFTVKISTHTPRAGSDETLYGYNYCMFKFQPTLPVRGVTLTSVHSLT